MPSLLTPRDLRMVYTKYVTEILGGWRGQNKEVGGTKLFGQLILRKIIKTVATRCHHFKAKTH